MAGKKKYYTVWNGVSPGVYTSWTECQLQVKGYKGARYKSFDTMEEALCAFATPADLFFKHEAEKREKQKEKERPIVPKGALADRLPKDFDWNCLAVDAACSGNPGKMEYRGVYLGNEQEMFHFGPIYGTNNIGEFLAIVHGLAHLQLNNMHMPIYSDSRNALLWVKKKKCNTKLPRNEKTEALYNLIERAERWLNTHTYDTPLLKWDTEKWGEIPADFGRK